ncbi:MAG: hypothetical protein FWC47_15690 [Oscillospiraceae bacterium]|nr:hypothetical protein [Oscillospiraceae bacterium]
MQKFKNLVICSLILMIFFSFAGCNRHKVEDNTTSSQVEETQTDEVTDMVVEDTTSKPIDEYTVDDVISAAINNANGIENYDLNVDVYSDMTFLGFPIVYTVTTTGTGFANPMKIMTNSTVIVRNVSRTDITSYMEESGGTTYVYSKTNNGNWTTTENQNASSTLGLLTLCLSSIKGTDMSDDDVNGVSAYKIQGTIDPASIEQIVTQMGLAKSLAGGNTNLDLSGIYDGLGDMGLTLWIEKDTFYAFKYTMDMSEISSRILQKMKEAGVSMNGMALGSVGIKTYNITGSLSNINNAQDFDIPSEARQ